MSNQLTGNGVSNRVLSYPADYGVDYLGYRVFQEWSCKDAELRLTSPECITLADFKAYPTSVIQKSGPCHHDEPLDIVYLDKGPDEQNYEGLDLAGKLIFVRDAHMPYFEWAIKKRGALGIISDFSADGRGTQRWLELATVSKYRSFWYYEEPDVTPFGFSIRPTDGERLAQICAQTAREHEKDPSRPKCPQATCFVDSSFQPGQIELVEAEIKGETDEEVWITAHSCHPRSCANDNASGVAAATEAICAINRLIAAGKLPKPKRTLKVLLMPEFTGTFPYLAEHANVKKCVGAINLDMVGGKQSLGYGPLSVVGLPYSTPSIADDLCGVVLNELKKEAVTFGGDRILPMFNALRVPFMGGSDHLILSDPAMGIPTPMLLQWPDTFYHTGGDTLDKICPHLIKKSSTLAAAYAYLLCTLEPQDLATIFRESLSEFVAACNRTIEEHKPGDMPLAQKLGYIHEYYTACADSAVALFTGEQAAAAKRITAKHKATLDALYASLAQQDEPPLEGQTDSRVPKRLTSAIVINVEQNAGTPELKQTMEDFSREWGSKLKRSTSLLVQYHMDGQRTVDEIADRVLFETRGESRQAVVEYIYLLEKLGICAF